MMHGQENIKSKNCINEGDSKFELMLTNTVVKRKSDLWLCYVLPR